MTYPLDTIVCNTNQFFVVGTKPDVAKVRNFIAEYIGISVTEIKGIQYSPRMDVVLYVVDDPELLKELERRFPSLCE